jgi:cbb3-type cytochrome oxidase subunit 3
MRSDFILHHVTVVFVICSTAIVDVAYQPKTLHEFEEYIRFFPISDDSQNNLLYTLVPSSNRPAEK